METLYYICAVISIQYIRTEEKETKMDTVNRKLLDFIAESPTAFHAAHNVAKALDEAGYTRLYEDESWRVGSGKYYVMRNSSSVIALNIPKTEFRGFMMMAAHSDSPSFKIKEYPEDRAAGQYVRLNTERYGGMIASTWLDRPLSAAGRVMVRENGRIAEKLVNIERDLMMIPSVAIHMERGVNDGKKFDPNTDMLPVISAADAKNSLRALAAESAGVSEDDILSTDLFLYPRTSGTVWGADEEFVSSPRLDDLQCVFACLNGFLGAKPAESAAVLCVFDNEEVGSGTKQGADSTFLEDTLVRVCEALGRSGAEYRAALNQSFMVSADNAHAVHPNHPEFADRIDRPAINGGIVIKFNANQKYTTDSVSAAVFAELCRDAGVPVQRFTNRADMPGGSTLGNISSAHVSVDTVDIGLPQLAMHSCYETAGARDTEYLIRAARELFSRSFRRGRNGMEI